MDSKEMWLKAVATDIFMIFNFFASGLCPVRTLYCNIEDPSTHAIHSFL